MNRVIRASAVVALALAPLALIGCEEKAAAPAKPAAPATPAPATPATPAEAKPADAKPADHGTPAAPTKTDAPKPAGG